MTPSHFTTLPVRRSSACVRVLRGTVAFAVLLVALVFVAWVGRAPLLRSAADWWIVSDPVEPADVVAIFGGGLEVRPFAAAAYFRQGLVGKILLSNIGESPAEKIGVLLSHFEANRRVLLKLGVPDSAIEPFGANLANTHEEALALREWAARNGAHSIIVPTEFFSARRLRWMLRRVFAGKVDIRVPALDPIGYGRDDWWKKENGIIGFQNELMKYLFYRVKY
jgi:uncharacterized SAM-binding protein YcdF (DUF218 family)